MDNIDMLPTPITDVLWTERTYLTLLTMEDLPDMEEMAREPDTFQYIKKLRVMNETEYTQFLHLKLRQIKENKGYHWAVRLRGDIQTIGGPAHTWQPHGFIGAVNLNPIGSTDRLQIGCQLKRDYWGQGFASELTARVLTFAIHELKLPAVYGVFEKANNVSRRLLEKLGFVLEESSQEQELQIEVHKFAAPSR